jgi:iron complex transport system substrate-binding protein
VAIHRVSATGVAPMPVYALDSELLRALRPDLILTQDICDVCAIGSNTVFEVTTKTLGYSPQFVTIQAAGLEDILQSILEIGRACNVEAAAERYVVGLRTRIGAVRAGVVYAGRPKRVLCLEWTRPLMAAGLWTADLVDIAGGYQNLTQPGGKSRTLGWDDLLEFEPEQLLFMPCGCDLIRSRAELAAIAADPRWAAIPAVQTRQVYVFDGRVPSRHGPRTVDVLEAFAEILHPRRISPRWRGRLYEAAA